MNESSPSRRPRPSSFVQVDLDNAYARLGISPLAPTRDIKQLINDKIRELKSQLSSKSEASFGDVEDQINRLQQIEEKIASPKARARYDQQHPQNELLTIQPCPSDHFDDPRFRAGLVTAWLVETLGSDRLLPTADCLAFWRVENLPLAEMLSGLVSAHGPARQSARGPDVESPTTPQPESTAADSPPSPAAPIPQSPAEHELLTVEQLTQLAEKAAGQAHEQVAEIP